MFDAPLACPPEIGVTGPALHLEPCDWSCVAAWRASTRAQGEDVVLLQLNAPRTSPSRGHNTRPAQPAPPRPRPMPSPRGQHRPCRSRPARRSRRAPATTALSTPPPLCAGDRASPSRARSPAEPAARRASGSPSRAASILPSFCSPMNGAATLPVAAGRSYRPRSAPSPWAPARGRASRALEAPGGPPPASSRGREGLGSGHLRFAVGSGPAAIRTPASLLTIGVTRPLPRRSPRWDSRDGGPTSPSPGFGHQPCAGAGSRSARRVEKEARAVEHRGRGAWSRTGGARHTDAPSSRDAAHGAL